MRARVKLVLFSRSPGEVSAPPLRRYEVGPVGVGARVNNILAYNIIRVYINNNDI